MSTTNQLFAIAPYWADDLQTWAFDDAGRGLQREPFVAGVPAIIDDVLRTTLGRGDDRLHEPFRAVFSAGPFPGAMEAVREQGESGGAWYTLGGRRGWLCPALLRYFDEPPPSLFVAVEELRSDGDA